jgi:hypothetical protein
MNIGEIVTVVTYEPVEVESEETPVEEKRQEEELVSN